tara:strand:+ start:2619 stop:2789 length:171 start_codon:yes stop_codon:yes gene_type:complete
LLYSPRVGLAAKSLRIYSPANRVKEKIINLKSREKKEGGDLPPSLKLSARRKDTLY